MSTQYYNPVEVITGAGCFKELPQVVARFGAHALVIRSPRAPDATALLDMAGVGVVEADPLRGEPTLDYVEAARALARREGVEVVVGVGGGSPMDAAKAVAGLFPHAGPVHEYHTGARKVPGGGLPFVAVPTTAGSGAEVTKNAVLTDPARGVKESLRHDGWFARAALVDPELTYSAPPDVTAASGSDALCQAIEAYVSTGAMPVTDALAKEAIARIARALPVACAQPQDAVARADMLYGSLLAGLALSNARLGGVHGMAHPLGVRFNLPHGLICGLLLPYVMEYNIEHARRKYEHVAILLGVGGAEAGIARVRRLLEKINIPLRLRDVGVDRAQFPAIVVESLPSGSLKHNPRKLGAEDVTAILEAAW
ncbi:MAG: iron-containing alcohol dehydrogenase [Anaerolineae bacterium]|nr:iron-containing alcohol dehydrogenase [Anaerolineae bacterium]